VAHQFFLACPRRSLCVLLGHLVLVHKLFESCTFFGGAFCVAHRALLNVELVCNCKLAARIDLRGLRWNASLRNAIDIFFRDHWLSRRFYTQQTTCSPELSQN
jgi:hypothetical protein